MPFSHFLCLGNSDTIFQTMQEKFIFITGGVLSSLGKGIASASIAALLEANGLKVALMKLDPYLNVDPGTMNPFQHGEVYVTDDGAETDLDLGHYYRFTNSPLSKLSNATSGQIYNEVLKKERKGDYLGKTIQVIPHITNEIQKRILDCSKQVKGIDITLVEIGGTVGDIESQPFLEAIRQFRQQRLKDCMNIHLTYVFYIEHAQELKTKPTQHSVQKLQQSGIFPDMILCRCKNPLPQEIRSKISLFCNVPSSGVIDLIDTNEICQVPLLLKKAHTETEILQHLHIRKKKSTLVKWETIVDNLKKSKKTVTITIVGKYLKHQDAYKSIFEALKHGALANFVNLRFNCIDVNQVPDTKGLEKLLQKSVGILVPGGFGKRGWEEKLIAAKIAREKNIPYLGICLGMHVMIVEFARNVLHLSQANSTEIDEETNDPIISLLSEQKGIKNLGGTMRLGAYPCQLAPKSKSFQIYKKRTLTERHRHRYEFNNTYQKICEEKGLLVTGIWKEENLCEIVENRNHPWMIGVQFHPEFQSKPLAPHPLFKAFITHTLLYEKNCRS